VAVLQPEDTAKIATAQTVLTMVVMRMQEQDRMQSMLYWNVELRPLCQKLGAGHVQCKVLREKRQIIHIWVSKQGAALAGNQNV